MARQILLQLPLGPPPPLPHHHIPHLERRVLAGADEQARVGAEAAHVHGPHVAAQRGDESAVARAPQLDGVVEAAAGDEGAVRGEGHVVDLFLVAEQAGDGFGVVGGRVPEVDCEVVACGDEAFGDAAVDGGGCLVALARFCGFLRWGGGDVACVVVVGGAEDEVGGEGEVVDPVGVRGEGGDQGAFGGVPQFYGFVVRGRVDGACAAPADAGDGGLVAGEDEVDALGNGVPDADGGVFGAGGEARGGGVLPQVVGLPSQAVDPFGVAFQRLPERLAGLGVPEADGVVH